MNLSEGEDCDDHLYTQMKNCNLMAEKQQTWQPIDGVGQLSDEQFVGNYMTDSSHLMPIEKLPRADSSNAVELKISVTTDQSVKKNVHHLDISEHQTLSTDEYLSDICVSHIESAILVYIMTESDYERAIELQQAMRCIETLENQPLFKPIENRLCAVKNNNEWLRARCLAVSADKQIVKVQYIDWGNIVHLKTEDIRSLPQEFYQESSCCIPCRLDGVNDIALDFKVIKIYNEILIGSDRDNFDLSIIVTKGNKKNEHPHIVLYRKSINLNDQIYKSFPSKKNLTDEEHLIAQFTYELPLMIGEEYRALLSSYNGTDGSFYVLIDHDNYNQFIEKILNQITDDFQAPILLRPLMMVCVKYDGKYSRAWIKSIENDQYQVFYVDWGNEEMVSFNRIRACPEGIRYIPWLANRVKFHREQLTSEEFDEFWKTLEGDYCQVFVIDQFNDHYAIEIKYDYLSMIRKRRARLFVEKNFSSC